MESSKKHFKIGDYVLYGPMMWLAGDEATEEEEEVLGLEPAIVLECDNFIEVADIMIQKTARERHRVPYIYLQKII